jgi:predicted transcriptional regulator
LREISDIERLEQSSAAGPKPSFSKYDILKTLEVMYRSGPVGRKKLSSILNLGEGATRTILDHLQEATFVRKTMLGCELTEKGKKIGQRITRKIAKQSPLEENVLVAGKFAYGMLVRNSSSRVSNGIEQRDAAIKAGAKSATTIICKNGNLIMPPETRIPPKEWSETLKMIYTKFDPQDDDVIVISGADDAVLAELGARAGSWTLIES